MAADPTLQRPPALRAARWATRAQFAVLGGVTGAWGVHIPTAKVHCGLDAAALSIALLAAAAGAVACLTQAGRVVARFGARRIVRLPMAGQLLRWVMPVQPGCRLRCNRRGHGQDRLDLSPKRPPGSALFVRLLMPKVVPANAAS